MLTGKYDEKKTCYVANIHGRREGRKRSETCDRNQQVRIQNVSAHDQAKVRRREERLSSTSSSPLDSSSISLKRARVVCSPYRSTVADFPNTQQVMQEVNKLHQEVNKLHDDVNGLGRVTENDAERVRKLVANHDKQAQEILQLFQSTQNSSTEDKYVHILCHYIRKQIHAHCFGDAFRWIHLLESLEGVCSQKTWNQFQGLRWVAFNNIAFGNIAQSLIDTRADEGKKHLSDAPSIPVLLTFFSKEKIKLMREERSLKFLACVYWYAINTGDCYLASPYLSDMDSEWLNKQLQEQRGSSCSNYAPWLCYLGKIVLDHKMTICSEKITVARLDYYQQQFNKFFGKKNRENQWLYAYCDYAEAACLSARLNIGGGKAEEDLQKYLDTLDNPQFISCFNKEERNKLICRCQVKLARIMAKKNNFKELPELCEQIKSREQYLLPLERQVISYLEAIYDLWVVNNFMVAEEAVHKGLEHHVQCLCSLKNKSLKCQYVLAKLYTRLGRTDEAEKVLKKCGESSEYGQRLQALNFRKMGRFTDAQEIYKKMKGNKSIDYHVVLTEFADCLRCMAEETQKPCAEDSLGSAMDAFLEASALKPKLWPAGWRILLQLLDAVTKNGQLCFSDYKNRLPAPLNRLNSWRDAANVAHNIIYADDPDKALADYGKMNDDDLYWYVPYEFYYFFPQRDILTVSLRELAIKRKFKELDKQLRQLGNIEEHDLRLGEFLQENDNRAQAILDFLKDGSNNENSESIEACAVILYRYVKAQGEGCRYIRALEWMYELEDYTHLLPEAEHDLFDRYQELMVKLLTAELFYTLFGAGGIQKGEVLAGLQFLLTLNKLAPDTIVHMDSRHHRLQFLACVFWYALETQRYEDASPYYVLVDSDDDLLQQCSADDDEVTKCKLVLINRIRQQCSADDKVKKCKLALINLLTSLKNGCAEEILKEESGIMSLIVKKGDQE